jgi:hypothetical protein
MMNQDHNFFKNSAHNEGKLDHLLQMNGVDLDKEEKLIAKYTAKITMELSSMEDFDKVRRVGDNSIEILPLGNDFGRDPKLKIPRNGKEALDLKLSTRLTTVNGVE